MPRLKFRPFSEFPKHRLDEFWNNVLIGEPSECWPWLASEGSTGYGQFGIDCKPWIASRIAYYSQYGIDPMEHEVCHRCDNPPCCNPFHLFLGTHSDNMQDCSRKGRLRPGDPWAGKHKNHIKPTSCDCK